MSTNNLEASRMMSTLVKNKDLRCLIIELDMSWERDYRHYDYCELYPIRIKKFFELLKEVRVRDKLRLPVECKYRHRYQRRSIYVYPCNPYDFRYVIEQTRKIVANSCTNVVIWHQGVEEDLD